MEGSIVNAENTDDSNLDETVSIVNLEQLICALRNSNKKDNASVLLIGAGVSISAGIPSAAGLIDDVLKKYPYIKQAVEDASNYNEVMSKISQEERNEIIVPYIKNARINLAHIAIAQLFKAGYFRRILTVNFDPLLINACALVGMNPLPAIYDLGAVKDVDGDRLIDPCIIYLNGQHTGAILRNTETELQEHKKVLKEVIEATGFRSTWVVSGYSGDCDPLFDIINEQSKFKRGLYWFVRSNKSAVKITKNLCDKNKDANVLVFENADEYFVELAQALNEFPPRFLVEPFDYVKELAYRVKVDTGTEAVKEVYKFFDEQIEKALNALSDQKEEIAQATSLLQGNNEDKELLPRFKAAKLFDEGNQFFYKENFLEAADKYRQVLSIEPHQANAFYNWGLALMQEAEKNSSVDLAKNQELMLLASQKYKQALAINPNKFDALNNLGLLLRREANFFISTDIDKSCFLLKSANEYFDKSLEINPQHYQAAYNWGLSLASEARIVEVKNTERSKELWMSAIEKYQKVLEIKSDFHEALDNWATSLIHLYHLTQESNYLTAAQEKEQLAENIKAGSGSYNLACSYALQNNAVSAIQWLNTTKEHHKLPTEQHISQDKDFDLIRNTPEFQQWWQETFPPQSLNPST